MIGEPNAVYAKYFISNSYIADISDSQITFANVSLVVAIIGISIMRGVEAVRCSSV